MLNNLMRRMVLAGLRKNGRESLDYDIAQGWKVK